MRSEVGNKGEEGCFGPQITQITQMKELKKEKYSGTDFKNKEKLV